VSAEIILGNHRRKEIFNEKIFLILAFVGLVLPYYYFVSFFLENGLNLPLFFENLFANNIVAFFAVDLIITALVFLIFSYQETLRYQEGNWWTYLLATLFIGLSFSLLLFLYFREQRIQRMV
jgi:hypothetical protein